MATVYLPNRTSERIARLLAQTPLRKDAFFDMALDAFVERHGDLINAGGSEVSQGNDKRAGRRRLRNTNGTGKA